MNAPLWQESFPVVVDRANGLYRAGLFGVARDHYLLAAELARVGELTAYETEMLHAAEYCNERAAGREPTEAWS